MCYVTIMTSALGPPRIWELVLLEMPKRTVAMGYKVSKPPTSLFAYIISYALSKFKLNRDSFFRPYLAKPISQSMSEDSEKMSYIAPDEKTTLGIEPCEEKGEVTPITTNHLARNLSARQVSMIAIGGTIGTGLFLGTGKAIATGGPGSTLLGYAVCGFIIFLTMLSLGEMAAFIPVSGSFCTFAR